MSGRKARVLSGWMESIEERRSCPNELLARQRVLFSTQPQTEAAPQCREWRRDKRNPGESEA
jgi:hypothetical protein